MKIRTEGVNIDVWSLCICCNLFRGADQQSALGLFELETITIRILEQCLDYLNGISELKQDHVVHASLDALRPVGMLSLRELEETHWRHQSIELSGFYYIVNIYPQFEEHRNRL